MILQCVRYQAPTITYNVGLHNLQFVHIEAETKTWQNLADRMTQKIDVNKEDVNKDPACRIFGFNCEKENPWDDG